MGRTKATPKQLSEAERLHIAQAENLSQSTSASSSAENIEEVLTSSSSENAEQCEYDDVIRSPSKRRRRSSGSALRKLGTLHCAKPDDAVCKLNAAPFRLSLLNVSCTMATPLHDSIAFDLHRAGDERVVLTTTNGTQTILAEVSADDDEWFSTFLHAKLFALVLPSMEQLHTCNLLDVDVFLRSSAFSQLSHASEAIATGSRKRTLLVQSAMKRIFNIEFSELESNVSKKENISGFYQALRLVQCAHGLLDNASNMDVQHVDLVPRLREYQKAAVKWMLQREAVNEDEKSLHPLFTSLTAADGFQFYYNVAAGTLVREQPHRETRVPGGILADEMGLGKTVEMLACILLHPKLSNNPPPSIDDDIRAVLSSLISDVAFRIEGDDPGERPQRRKAQKRSFRETLDLVYVAPSVAVGGCLECTCGAMEDGEGERLQCEGCGSWQHTKCVNWEAFVGVRRCRYLCPHCVIAEPPIESGSTLIISPSSICSQWYQEIQKHVRRFALKVFVYQGSQRAGFIQPAFLAAQDVVITTYETLRTELNYVDLPHSSRLRYPKRFLTAPSPLTAVNWWRVCLDEAQLVEHAAAKAAKMCLRLSAVNRWCVTGTPVQKSVDDLYGLCLLCGVDPYWVRCWWEKLLLKPYRAGVVRPLLAALAPVLWRTEKKDVLDQIDIPKQTETVNWLDFSPVEEHFYRRTQDDCAQQVRRAVAKLTGRIDEKVADLDAVSIESLFRQLLRCRQACCHPQIVRGQFVPIQKTMLSMEEVLDEMVKKTTLECEDERRTIVFAMNGLAALHTLCEEYSEAAELYREVLRSSTDTAVRTDPLQMIHTVHNLRGLLEGPSRTRIPPTLRDEQLGREEKELKAKYLEKSLNTIATNRAEMEVATGRADELAKELSPFANWWMGVLEQSIQSGLEIALLQRVHTSLEAAKMTYGGGLIGNFRDVRGLQYVLQRLLDQLDESRAAVVAAIVKLYTMDPIDGDELPLRAQFCHLRPQKSVASARCQICLCQELFDTYEAKLYNFKRGSDDVETVEMLNEEVHMFGDLRKGGWAESQLETALKSIALFARANFPSRITTRRTAAVSDLEELDRGSVLHLKLFEQWKKEFRALRAASTAVRDHVSLRDEVCMATERLRLASNDEDVADARSFYGESATRRTLVVHRAQIGGLREQFEVDRTFASTRLEQKLGQAAYLRNLKAIQFGGAGENPDECPVCRTVLGKSWSVLNCGHCLCHACVRVLLKHPTGGVDRAVRCPICRTLTAHGQVSFVHTAPASASTAASDREPPIRGSFSTKIEAVVRRVRRIGADEPDAKMLVFSGWNEVLDIVERALRANAIRCVTLNGGSTKSAAALAAFRSPTSDVNVLLLPYHSGANGLNLTEANHVLLVEPILNVAAERQAIGRVDRIGQRRATVVHRFFVRGAVEERLWRTLREHAEDVGQPIAARGEGRMGMDALTARLSVGEFGALFESVD